MPDTIFGGIEWTRRRIILVAAVSVIAVIAAAIVVHQSGGDRPAATDGSDAAATAASTSRSVPVPSAARTSVAPAPTTAAAVPATTSRTWEPLNENINPYSPDTGGPATTRTTRRGGTTLAPTAGSTVPLPAVTGMPPLPTPPASTTAAPGLREQDKAHLPAGAADAATSWLSQLCHFGWRGGQGDNVEAAARWADVDATPHPRWVQSDRSWAGIVEGRLSSSCVDVSVSASDGNQSVADPDTQIAVIIRATQQLAGEAGVFLTQHVSEVRLMHLVDGAWLVGPEVLAS